MFLINNLIIDEAPDQALLIHLLTQKKQQQTDHCLNSSVFPLLLCSIYPFSPFFYQPDTLCQIIVSLFLIKREDVFVWLAVDWFITYC